LSWEFNTNIPPAKTITGKRALSSYPLKKGLFCQNENAIPRSPPAKMITGRTALSSYPLKKLPSAKLLLLSGNAIPTSPQPKR